MQPLHSQIFDRIYFILIFLLSRYLVLASSAMTAAPDHKAATSICFETIGLEEDKYRLGHTKLFFRTGKPFHEKPKGQLISKCPFGVTKSTKKLTNFL